MASPAGGTPIDPGIIQRAIRGVRYALTGKIGNIDEFFGPAQPLAPIAQDAALGRQFDYPFGYNLNYRPRSYEPTDFPTLRALAENYDLVRLAIETRKDQMGKLSWQIVRRDGEDAENDPQAQAITDFLETPDQHHDFSTWQRMFLEDLFVLDAPTCYIRRTKGGQPFAFEPIDGATIKPVIDETGRAPLAPQPAYQQIIKGLPAVDYSRDELLYLPRNRRTHKVYGFSPVEQILTLVNIGIRRETFQLQYYTEGNVPDMLLATPQGWSAQQLKEFQLLFDEVLAGDSGARRRIRFVPGGMEPKPVRNEPLFDLYDEWLARVVCYAFSLPPTAFVKQMNRATATSAQEVALEEGLAPIMDWWVHFMNRLIRLGWNTRDYQFAWVSENDIDPQVQAAIDVMYAGGAQGNGPKIRSVQEIRDDHGWGPLPEDLKAEADAQQQMTQARLEAAKNPPPAPGAPPNGQQQEPAKDGEKPPAASKLAKAGRRSLRRYPY